MKRLAGMFVILLALAEWLGPERMLINGAGADFPGSYLFQMVLTNFIRPTVPNQLSVGGSGGRYQADHDGTVDFGASDGPMNDDQLKAFKTKNGAGIFHFPTVLGGWVPTYNVPGVSEALNFTPEALSGIFLGRISKWNDPAIAGANKGIALPANDIVVIHRSDGSGPPTFGPTTFRS